MEIHVTKDGKQWGPCSKDEILAYLRDGDFRTSDLAWQDGMVEWKPLFTLLGIPPAAPAPQAQSVAYSMGAVVYQNYLDVPWYRRSGWNSGLTLTYLLLFLIYAIARVGIMITTPANEAVTLSLFVIAAVVMMVKSICLLLSCILVLSGSIYYNKKDAKGHLKTWTADSKLAAVIFLVLQATAIISYLNDLIRQLGNHI